MKEFKMIVPEDDEIVEKITHKLSFFVNNNSNIKIPFSKHEIRKYLYFHNQTFYSGDCDMRFDACGFAEIDFRTFLSFELVGDDIIMNIDKAQQLWNNTPHPNQSKHLFMQTSGRIQKETTGFDQYREFDKIVEQSAIIYRQKNHDYGDSFAKSVQKRGFIAALTRIEDKFQRIDNIISTGKIEVKSESLEDSLLDMANYCIMTAIEIRRKKFDNSGNL